ncbi:HlyD family secretion protein [Pleurocapsa sp. CCALA 161]|uniref:ABC exporter membrane fusion protein n=1 Tax=Pleurocapsa sp. CCALA 161 TaxID=2107688 RepID=UPI000D058B67|nr:ABC exporter membrane fusion protein [Pleurocapsa sp. CCALA 161]PSB09192.1 HlyD family secretion protein [Pleurocapsa sp. CCALA 161]
MNYITDKQNKSSKPLVKNVSAILVGLALILVGVTVYKISSTDTSQTEVPPPAMPEIKTVTALGRLEPSGEIIEISASSGSQGNRIEKLLVKQGDQIKAGDVIAVLDSRDRLQAALNQSQEQVRVAEANLALVRAGAKTGEIQAQQAAIARIEAERSNDIMAQTAMVDRMQAELNNAQVEYQRYQSLYQNGAISASEKDSKYLTLETAKKQLAEAKANLNRIKSGQQEQLAEAKATLDQIAEVRPVDVAVAEAEVREAQAAVQTAQAELDQAYIKSPQAGTVIKIMTRPGEVVASDRGIVRIGQTSQMYAVAEVYESDIDKVKLGQKVSVTSSAIAEKLTGTVETIGLEVERQEVVNTDPTANIDAKVVEVKVKLDPESSRKVAGLTNLLVDVRIDL